MEDTKDKKQAIREEITKAIEGLSEAERMKKAYDVETRLFEFANFLEAKIPLLYIAKGVEVQTQNVVNKCFSLHKVPVFPTFDIEKKNMAFYKIDNFKNDMVKGPRDILEPNPKTCKEIPIKSIDIAIIPGIAFDEKGGRIGIGDGYYDRLIPVLPVTTRKVSLAFEEQIVPQIPMESHDKFVDIIITDQRVIYKI